MEKVRENKKTTWLISEDEKKWQLFNNIQNDEETLQKYS